MARKISPGAGGFIIFLGPECSKDQGSRNSLLRVRWMGSGMGMIFSKSRFDGCFLLGYAAGKDGVHGAIMGSRADVVLHPSVSCFYKRADRSLDVSLFFRGEGFITFFWHMF